METQPVIAEVIAIGDELTTGQRLDTNSPWLSERLTSMGVRVLYHTTVADDLEANINVFRTAIERADVVVATGGLGPTDDDLTRPALAAAIDVELALDPSSEQHIRNLFASRGRQMPERNVVQAMFPEGSQAIPNPNGTAPGIDLAVSRIGRGDCRVFALPGVPAEMHGMWNTTVAPAVAPTMPTTRVTMHRRLKCFGKGESHIHEMLPEVIRRGREPLVGITASDATITLRITATGDDEAACLAAMEPTETQIRHALGNLVYGVEDEELQHAVARLLSYRVIGTIATVEDATGGLLAEWLSELVPGSALDEMAPLGTDFYRGGLVLRDSGLQTAGAVEAAAVDARRQFDADFGLAVSEAIRTGDPNEKKVLLALVNRSKARTQSVRMFLDQPFARRRLAKMALNLVRLHLGGSPPASR